MIPIDLKKLFESWGQTADQSFVKQQWLLSKWEVVEGVVWSDEKINLMLTSIHDGLELSNQKTLIDLGCGGGWILKGLTPFARKAYGLDFSQTMLANAVKYYGPEQASVFVAGEIGKLPLADHCVDCVLSYFVFLNFMDDHFVEGALKDVYRILKPGGRALIGQLPDITRSSDYDREKAAYLDYCRQTFTLGASHREVCQAPQKLFHKDRLRQFLDLNQIKHEFRPTFNPFYRPGQNSRIDWRFDLILIKEH